MPTLSKQQYLSLLQIFNVLADMASVMRPPKGGESFNILKQSKGERLEYMANKQRNLTG